MLQSKSHRLLVQGGLALMIAHPSHENGVAVLEQVSKAMGTFVSDRDFVDILRLTEVSLVRGNVTPDEVTTLRMQLAEEFPSGDSLMNRELIRLLAYLQESSIIDRYLTYLKFDAPEIDRLHLALYLRFLESG